jgi:hypothetical protein
MCLSGQTPWAQAEVDCEMLTKHTVISTVGADAE